MSNANNPAKMPVFSTARAMEMMWLRAAGQLQAHELEWFASGAAAQVSADTGTLADVLMDIGAAIGCDDGSGAFTNTDSASNLMFNLSNQLSAIKGLADLAMDASYRVRQALEVTQ